MHKRRRAMVTVCEEDACGAADGSEMGRAKPTKKSKPAWVPYSVIG